MPHALRTCVVAALAVVVTLAISSSPTLAAPAAVTVRIEGLESTILPETAVTTDTRTVPSMSGIDCFGQSSSGAAYTLAGPTPLGALADGAAIAGVTYDLTDHYVSSFGLGLCRIGDEPSNSDGYWSIKVDHVYLTDRIDQHPLAPGDRVLWYRTPLWSPPTLDVATPLKAASGTPVTVVVSGYDDTGQATPAAGATVKMGSQQATSGPNGEAALTAPQQGTYQVSADKAGSIRSPAYTICTYRPEDGDCNAPASGVSVQAAPSAKIEKPVDGRIYGKFRKIAGSLDGNLGDARAVRLRLKRIRRQRCTLWLDGKARFAAKRRLRSTSCASAAHFDVPVGEGGKWSYRFRRPLEPGVYSLNARAVDSAGHVETAIRQGVNRVRFAVRHQPRRGTR